MTQIILELSAHEEGADLVLCPKKTGSDPTESDIVDAIAESEFKQYFILNENIKNAMAELFEVLKPLQIGQEGREIRYQVAEKRDASVVISHDTDQMAAHAEITSAYGGKHITARDILNAAQEANIIKGFSKESLLSLAQKAARAESGTQTKKQIATGKQPIRGKDAKIRHMVQSAQERILKPKERDDGTVDMRDLGDILCVKTGDLLAQKVPATTGRQGYTVTGTILEPEPGEDFQLTAGEGTKISDNDENYLISEIIGMPKIIENGMMVDQVFQVKDVDVGSGHINFEGSVIIQGNVCEGMKVIASGDVTIGGYVESAVIEARGDITIQQGIIGRQFDPESEAANEHSMSVVISAGGNLFAKYAQYAELNSKRNLLVENQMMHCQVNALGDIWVGKQDKANGKLIGGHINAGMKVSAGVVGAPAGSLTTIEFKRKLTELKDDVTLINDRLDEVKKRTDDLKSTIVQIKKMPKTEKTKEVLAKAVKTYQHHAKLMADVLLEQEAAEQRFADMQLSHTVEATEKLYHNVECHIGEFHERSRREHGPSRIGYKERKVIIDPIVST